MFNTFKCPFKPNQKCQRDINDPVIINDAVVINKKLGMKCGAIKQNYKKKTCTCDPSRQNIIKGLQMTYSRC